MVTLFGALIGFISSLAPEFFKVFRDREDRKHELEILKLQIEQKKLGLSGELEEIKIQAETFEQSELYKTYYSGVKWVDALNGTVRPVLSYSFFVLYASIKLSQLFFLETITYSEILILWGPEDQAIFSGVISFYFGSRALAKYRSL